jgi:hypothetical protein
MDKIDGPYYFFPLIKRLRDALPGWVPLVGLDLGDTNVVPVDYVAEGDGPPRPRARPRRPGLPPGQPGAAAGRSSDQRSSAAPRGRRSSPRRSTAVDGVPRMPRLPPGPALRRIAPRTPEARRSSRLLDQTSAASASPSEVLAHVALHRRLRLARHQRRSPARASSVPPLESYARTLWDYWEENLDTRPGRDRSNRGALNGKYVVITGASSGIGEVTALKVAQAAASRPRRARQGEARGDKRRSSCAAARRTSTRATSPTSTRSTRSASSSPPSSRIDFLVNNAGRSIRRSLKLSTTASTTSSAPCSSTTSARSGS